ncbi:MurR/RpiR family transcriptional regulator [Streptococcus anginosus]|uniref:SIS (Sugar ISomerase) domain containing transcriptional regulator n=1 Tax=Streptococcus anginosus TaxID=1328 RepID=A0A448AK55_STRAP|nr:MurR/RpiR family transcriptional regulator [Streptococcus anginosus]GAD40106.1 hypothetical protein ANG3_0569 [Streptococcus intermedius SK54 = ATCC 27335]EGL44556.1 transcriptional regulator, RpiR family [Streptococcus anginosus SK52 = DSM 20563]MBZ2157594.1 MurR/RpiR family transcriptional regulator [Streptococcus anginosus]ORE82395.1 MurR/RpiR family transcriptional regulator [Streptococcus anginosus SK52 = DSM 20563]UEB01828.1 MurR/RpiR family transcriptional regulator [Streptococcus an
MLLDQLEDQATFTQAEKEIANFILANLFQVQEMTASELGRASFTSKGSVFRFCKKLGFSGYEAFKRSLTNEYNEKKRIQLILEKNYIHQNTTVKDVIAIVPGLYDNVISQTKLLLKPQVLTRIVQKLKRTSHVDIYGVGVTEVCARNLAFKLQYLGISCSVHTTINEHYIHSIDTKSTVAIILSLTGENPLMIEIADYLKKFNQDIFGIGGIIENGLSSYCQEYIPIFQKDAILSLEVIYPVLSMSVIIDIIFTSLMVVDFDTHVSNALKVANKRMRT